VSDFGLAKVRDESRRMSQVGNWAWMAPEVIRNEKYNEKADIYSFGVVLCEIITQLDGLDLPRTKEFTLDIEEVKNSVPLDCPTEFLELAFICSRLDPHLRPNFSEVLIELEKIMKIIKLKTLARPYIKKTKPTN